MYLEKKIIGNLTKNYSVIHYFFIYNQNNKVAKY